MSAPIRAHTCTAPHENARKPDGKMSSHHTSKHQPAKESNGRIRMGRNHGRKPQGRIRRAARPRWLARKPRRGEAHDQSDIDLVVLLDSLCANDLDRYRAIVQNAPQSNLAGAPFRQNGRIPAHEIGAFSRTGRQRGPHPGHKQKLGNPSPQKQSRAGRARRSSLELV